MAVAQALHLEQGNRLHADQLLIAAGLDHGEFSALHLARARPIADPVTHSGHARNRPAARLRRPALHRRLKRHALAFGMQCAPVRIFEDADMGAAVVPVNGRPQKKELRRDGQRCTARIGFAHWADAPGTIAGGPGLFGADRDALTGTVDPALPAAKLGEPGNIHEDTLVAAHRSLEDLGLTVNPLRAWKARLMKTK